MSGAAAEPGPPTALAAAVAAAADGQPDAGVAAAATELGLDASMFKVVHGSSGGGVWELEAPSVLPRFCNAREGSGSPPEWHLSVEGAQNLVSVPVPSDEPEAFCFDEGRMRVEFEAGGDKWALELRSARAFERFLQEFNRAAYDNRHAEQDRDVAFWEQRAAQLRAGTDWRSKSQWHSLLAAFLGAQLDLSEVHPPQLLDLLATSAAAAMRSLQSGADVGSSQRAGLANLLGIDPFASIKEVRAAYEFQAVYSEDAAPSLAAASDPIFTFGPAPQRPSFSAAPPIPAPVFGPFSVGAANGSAANGAGQATAPFVFGAAASNGTAAGSSSAAGGPGIAGMPPPFVFSATANSGAAAVASAGAAASQPQPGSPAVRREEPQAPVCAICYTGPVTHGFLHEGTVHSCCCSECSQQMRQHNEHRCPICRRWIEEIVAVHVV